MGRRDTFACTLVALGLLLAPGIASSAELTRLASSFEESDPFDLSLEVAFLRSRHKSKLVRETYLDGGRVDFPELFHVAIDSRLQFDGRIGLWKDLEFHFGVPLVLSQNRTWRFVSGTDETNSTLINNCVQPNGELLDPGCAQTGAGSRPLFPLDADGRAAYRAGLGDMSFGLAYALFNELKDDSKPTWIVGLDYTAPTAEGLDPTLPTSTSSRGKLGDRVHRYRLYTSFSKTIGVADPYFQVHYTLPLRGPGWYSNCDHPDPANMGYPENCGNASWPRTKTAIQPAHVGGVVFGTELSAFRDTKQEQKLALDLRGMATYVSRARAFNEASDLFGKLLMSQDYLQVGGRIGLVGHLAGLFHLRGGATLLLETEHALTDERLIGDDPATSVNLSQDADKLNPSFDWRTDLVSRKLRAEESVHFTLDVGLSFNF